MSQSKSSSPIRSVWWVLNGLGASGVAQDEWEVLMRGDEGGGEVKLKPGAITAALLAPCRRTQLRGDSLTSCTMLHNNGQHTHTFSNTMSGLIHKRMDTYN